PVATPGCAWYADRLRALAATDLVLANSESTAADTRRLLGPDAPPVVNVRGAAEPGFSALPADLFPDAEQRVRARFGLDRPFLLYVGAMDARKNMAGAIAGFAALPPAARAPFDLVLACPLTHAWRADLPAAPERPGVRDRAG